MGADVPLDGGIARRAPQDPIEVEVVPADQLFMQVIAPAEIERIDIIRSGEVVGVVDCENQLSCTTAVSVDELQDGEYLYVRAVQADEHFAVSSPFFFSGGS